MTTPKLSSMWERLKAEMRHGFAMPPPLTLTDEDRALIDRVAGFVVRKKMTTPAIMLLETGKPLNFIASQFLVFIQPFATILLNEEQYHRFAMILEHRQGVEALMDAILRLDREGFATVMREGEADRTNPTDSEKESDDQGT